MNKQDVSSSERPTASSQNPKLPQTREDYTSLKRSLSRLTNYPSHEQFYRLHNDLQAQKQTNRGPQFHIDVSPLPPAAEIALAALQYLPTPVIVLGALKTVIVANEALGRLLGLRDGPRKEEAQTSEESITDILKGQTLSQIGLDMLSDGVPIWVSWEKFLDNLSAGRSGDAVPGGLAAGRNPFSDEEHTPSMHDDQARAKSRSPMRDKNLVHDTVVDVVVSSQHLQQNHHAGNHRHHKPRSPGLQTQCRMIISIWWLNDQKFYTLTFTSAAQTTRQHSHTHLVPRATSLVSKSSHSSHSHTPASSRTSSAVTSPSEVSLQTSAFPPTGAPAKAVVHTPPSTATDFQKVTQMKDAMLGAMHFPVLAMWKDESVVFPNAAARRLLEVDADPTSEESYDFMSRFKAYTADFQRELGEEENPIVKLCRTQKAFTKWEIGLINEKSGKKSNYNVTGHPVFEEKTGDFIAGLIALQDVTEYTERIANQNEENEQQFQLICDSMPQMLWTTTPTGWHDYFSQRWYDYTGLTPAESIGMGWKMPFHEEDMPETVKRWQHSLATGDEYLTEYRCRRHDGQWRWMLGRALPLKDNKTGEIVKWFGSCTDIQDVVDARNAGKRAREQLLDVLRHTEMTMWTTNRDSIITFFEGDIVPGIGPEELKAQTVGQNVYDAFKGTADAKFIAKFKSAIERILSGESKSEIYENGDAQRWFRSRLMPLRGRRGPNGIVDESYIDGVVGISTDVTQLKKKELENIKLLANESAAKEASKMKSNFLANMSHEIRTPIAGVLGMSELLMDTELDKEQTEFASNIQRSANSLLTVINDILDFSKIESGRLDIEEVQFSLGVVLRDVAKMLSFAADRKRLDFISDIHLGDDPDLVLLGDPGRIRQILTNLLTNSIKFTASGHVKLSALIIADTPDVTTIQFQVEDTGIGIEEDVKKRLFKPFSQADSSTARRFGGTGLGLTISKNLVDLMHGQISLESKLDQGTVAIFSIPFRKPEYPMGMANSLVDIAALPERLQSELSLSCNNSSVASTSRLRNRSPPVSAPNHLKPNSPVAHHISLSEKIATTANVTLTEEQRKNAHILVVEDNPVNQQIALKFIKSMKFSVDAVWNGKEALEYLLKASQEASSGLDRKPEHRLPALILMDVQMPVLDGYNCTHMLKRHAPYKSNELLQRIPIVAMTASAIQGDREKCERAGMDDYLAKPVKRTTLEKMITKWLTGEGKMKHLAVSSLTTGDGNEGGRPDLTRCGTDHSSNCPSIELSMGGTGSQTPISPFDITPSTPTLAAHAAAQLIQGSRSRRSSLSKTLLAADLPGNETEAERGMRRVNAEEMASSLRDAKLIAATDPSGNLDIGPTLSSIVKAGNVGSPLAETYLELEISDNSIHALTEANMERLNADLVDDHLPIGVSPRLMPELSVLSRLTDAEIAARTDGYLPMNLTSSQSSSPPTISITAARLAGESKDGTLFGSVTNRPQRDNLSPMQRKSSDWSESTAKP